MAILTAPSSISYANGILSGSGASVNTNIDEYDYYYKYGYEISVLPEGSQTWQVYYHYEQAGSFSKTIAIAEGSQIKVRRFEEYGIWDYELESWDVSYDYSPTYSPTITYTIPTPTAPQVNYDLATDVLSGSTSPEVTKFVVYKATDGDATWTEVTTLTQTALSFTINDFSTLLGVGTWDVMVRAFNGTKVSNDSDAVTISVAESTETVTMEQAYEDLPEVAYDVLIRVFNDQPEVNHDTLQTVYEDLPEVSYDTLQVVYSDESEMAYDTLQRVFEDLPEAAYDTLIVVHNYEEYGEIQYDTLQRVYEDLPETAYDILIIVTNEVRPLNSIILHAYVSKDSPETKTGKPAIIFKGNNPVEILVNVWKYNHATGKDEPLDLAGATVKGIFEAIYDGSQDEAMTFEVVDVGKVRAFTTSESFKDKPNTQYKLQLTPSWTGGYEISTIPDKTDLVTVAEKLG